MNFSMITLSPNMDKRQDCAIQILIALLYILKQKIFIRIMRMMLKDGLIHQIMMKRIKDLFQQEKTKKVTGKYKDELGGKIMTEFSALRAKAYAYKLDGDTQMEKAKGTKKCIVKREIIFKNMLCLMMQY